jgi:hypothetical protein
MTTTTPLGKQFTTEQREQLGKLADRLISGGAGLPSATEADVHHDWIDRTLSARPDLFEVVASVLGEPGEAQGVLDRLRSTERERFDQFTFAVAGAYLINPRVRKLLGYPGAAPEKNLAFPDEADAYLEDGILDPVIERGPIYRPTPDEP